MKVFISYLRDNEFQYFVPSSRINKLIYSRKWKVVPGAGLVKVGIIYAYHPFAIVLLNKDRIGHPL